MRRVGLVGGLGPESTIDYYRRILAGWNTLHPASAPAIVIDSLDVQQALRLVADDRPSLIEYLFDSIARLARAGANFIAMTANTPHVVFDDLAERSPVPLLSIVEECASELRRLGARRPLLLGTRFTVEAEFYRDVCARHQMDVVTPNPDDITWVHDRYIGELLKGKFTDETRSGFINLVERLRDARHVDAVILGGTELPLLLPAAKIAGLPSIDTTATHVAAIVKRLAE